MITTYTEQELEVAGTQAFQAAYPGKSVVPRSFLREEARSLAQLLSYIQAAIRDADRDGVPASEVVDGVLKARCSSTRLEEWAVTFGLPSNRAAGAFGRNGAVVAKNGAALVTGTAGTIVGSGAILRDASSTVQVELTAGVTIPGGGSISGSFQAKAPGLAGNLPVGTVLYWVSPVMGLNASVTLTAALTGGYDSEGDLDLLVRLLDHLRSPPHGGTAADLRRWVVEAVDLSTLASLGLNRGYVFRHRNGIGNTDVVITQPGSGSGRDPGATKLTKAQAYVDSKRLPSENDRLLRPWFPADKKLSIVLKVLPTARNAFDWADSGGITTVTVSTTQITIATANIPSSLAAAVGAGSQPRVQFTLSGTSPLPIQRRIVASSVAAPNTIYTLDSALPSAPGAAAVIYAGGGAVEPVSLAVLNYIDTMGPSQQSNTHDTLTDSWEAVISVSRLAQVALNATDSTGARACIHAPSTGVGVGVQIAVGAGALQSDDVQLYDNTPPNGPQLPEALFIRVLG